MNAPKPLVSILFLTLVWVINTRAEDHRETPDQFVTSWVAAFNENDADLMVSFYEDTEELDMLVSVGLWHEGIKGVRAAYQEDLEVSRYSASELHMPKIRVLDDIALVSFQHRFRYHFFENDSQWQIHIRTTMTLKRIDGNWKIVAEHSSPIQGIDRIKAIPARKKK